MKFSELRDDGALDLSKHVERLRLEVTMAQQGYVLPGEGAVPSLQEGEEELPPQLVHGFQSPEDFTIREQTLTYTNGDSYSGETLGALRHGRGTHTCSSGDVYSGQWRYDKREGTGKVTFTNGKEYEGEWKADKAHGEGVARYENGGVYVGQFEEDNRSGWGTHYFPTRDKYEGEWAGDAMEGKGQFTYADSSYFEGEFVAGERVKGKLVAADGSYEYSGGWKGDLRHGYGVCYQRGFFQYMGQWADDVQAGEGKCVYADGSTYDGEWQAGARHGRGKFAAGNLRYEGEWQEGRQHGQGAMQTEGGDKYVGEFAEGKWHGKGRCLYADGSKYEGEWQHDVRHGQGTCLFANGDKYSGEWKGDKRHGQGTCKFASGRKFRGEWEDDGWVQSTADPERSRVAGPGVTRAVAGQRAELVIEARDDAGVKRLSGGDEFQAAVWSAEPGGAEGAGDDAAVTAEVEDKGDGTYHVMYTATRAGLYQLHITVGPEEHVADSPYPLRVLPAKPCTRRSVVAGAGRGAATTGAPAAFTVAAHDEFGNRWFGDAAQLASLLPLEARLVGGAGSTEVPVALQPGRDGAFTCIYTAPTPGFWRLHIDCGGQPLPGTPFSVLAADPALAIAAGAAGAAGTCDAAAAKPAAVGDAQAAADDTAAVIATFQQPDGAASAAAAAAAPPIVRDQMAVWERIAAAAFAEPDGSMEGWDDDAARGPPKSSEDTYIEAHPGVPVVENLEDLWKVSKLQTERKKREEEGKVKRLQGMRAQLEKTFGPAQPPSEAEVAAAVKEIVQADAAAIVQEAAAARGKAAGGTPAAVAPAAAAAGAAPAGLRPGAGGRAALRAAAAALADLD